jgi:AraC-like DNA-binding protein
MEEWILRRPGAGDDLLLAFSTAHDVEPSVSLSWGGSAAIDYLTEAHVTRVPVAMIAAEPEQLLEAVTGRPSADPRRLMLVQSNWELVSQPSFAAGNPFGARPAWARTVGRLIREVSGLSAAAGEVNRSRLAQVILLTERFASDPRFSPELLAVALGISRRSLYLLTQDTIGGVSSLIRERRLDLAVDLLLSRPQLGLHEVATSAGFTGLQQLNRAALSSFAIPAAEIRRSGVNPRYPTLLDRTGA